MGNWKLKNIAARYDDLDGGENFGTNFRVELRLKYKPSTLASFKGSPVLEESPVLDWHEAFTTLWHHDKTYWEFQTNMFRHKPSSPTFDAWSKRYIAAYAFVTGESFLLRKGTVKFYDKKGDPVSPKEFAGKPAGTDEEKATVIREYLAKKGGVFVIEIHDVPSIVQAQATKHVERLLLFDCGLEGDSSQRVKAMQYLNVDSRQHHDNWQREFQISANPTRNNLPTQGLSKVDPPIQVSTPNEILFPGEFL